MVQHVPVPASGSLCTQLRPSVDGLVRGSGTEGALCTRNRIELKRSRADLSKDAIFRT